MWIILMFGMLIFIKCPMVTGIYSYRLQCPDISQRQHRASGYCTSKFRFTYTCLYDTNRLLFSEQCKKNPDYVTPGEKYVKTGSLRNVDCSPQRYQPFSLWSNVSGECLYKKSLCEGNGQVIFRNGTIISDRTCRCDFTNGYQFIHRPKNICFCIPSEEDCSCYLRKCSGYSILSPDYECVKEDQYGNSKCPPIDNENGSLQSPIHAMIKEHTDERIKKQQKSRLIVMIVISVLIISYAAIVFIIMWIQKQKVERKSENLFKRIFDKNELKEPPAVTKVVISKKTLRQQELICSLTMSQITDIKDFEPLMELLFPKFRINNSSCINVDGLRNTPLMYASMTGSCSIAELYLSYINVKNLKDQTPLMNACMYGSDDVVHLLLNNGAYVDAQNKKGETPLILACRYRRTEAVKKLIQFDADVNKCMKRKYSPLSIACSGIHSSYTPKIIETTSQTLTIEQKVIPCSRQCTNIISILINNKADVNMGDENEVTPLMVTCLAGCKESVRLLLEHVKDVNAIDNIDGSTALSWAMLENSGNNMEIINMLQQKGARIDGIDGEKNKTLII